MKGGEFIVEGVNREDLETLSGKAEEVGVSKGILYASSMTVAENIIEEVGTYIVQESLRDEVILAKSELLLSEAGNFLDRAREASSPEYTGD